MRNMVIDVRYPKAFQFKPNSKRSPILKCAYFHFHNAEIPSYSESNKIGFVTFDSAALWFVKASYNRETYTFLDKIV